MEAARNQGGNQGDRYPVAVSPLRMGEAHDIAEWPVLIGYFRPQHSRLSLQAPSSFQDRKPVEHISTVTVSIWSELVTRKWKGQSGNGL